MRGSRRCRPVLAAASRHGCCAIGVQPAAMLAVRSLAEPLDRVNHGLQCSCSSFFEQDRAAAACRGSVRARNCGCAASRRPPCTHAAVAGTPGRQSLHDRAHEDRRPCCTPLTAAYVEQCCFTRHSCPPPLSASLGGPDAAVLHNLCMRWLLLLKLPPSWRGLQSTRSRFAVARTECRLPLPRGLQRVAPWVPSIHMAVAAARWLQPIGAARPVVDGWGLALAVQPVP